MVSKQSWFYELKPKERSLNSTLNLRYSTHLVDTVPLSNISLRFHTIPRVDSIGRGGGSTRTTLKGNFCPKAGSVLPFPLRGRLLLLLTAFLKTSPLSQCCNTALVFFAAYGLWLFMAIRFPAYGRKSKFDEKTVFWVIRLNMASSWEMWLFWWFLSKFSSFWPVFKKK